MQLINYRFGVETVSKNMSRQSITSLKSRDLSLPLVCVALTLS